MRRAIVTRSRNGRPGLNRAAWTLMGLSHVPGCIAAWHALIATGFDPSQVNKCIALTVAVLFCALKVLDVACLRFHADRRSWIAIALAIALVHVGMVAPKSYEAVVPECSQVIAAAFLAGAMASVRRLLTTAKRSVGSAHASSLTLRALIGHNPRGMVWCDEFRPHCWVLASRLYALRGPPA